MLKSRTVLLHHQNPWISSVSTDVDGFVAVDSAIETLHKQIKSSNIEDSKYSLIFFVSTVYEMTNFNYEYIFEKISILLPNVNQIIGTTTGTAIGQNSLNSAPIESESRPAISMMLIPHDNKNEIQSNLYVINENDDISQLKYPEDGIHLLFSTEKSRNSVVNYMNRFSLKPNAQVFGSFASSVTSLQLPKLFMKKSKDSTIERMSNGIIGLHLSGKISANLFIAHSTIPVGPKFRLTETKDNEILAIEVNII